MTAVAVVTGSAARVADVADAIERRGIAVLRIERSEEPVGLESVPPACLDYYVQLPDDLPSRPATRAGAVAALFGQGLQSRFNEIDKLLPKMAPRCALVLVSGDTVDSLSSVEYPHAPTCVLEMLAEAVVADMSPSVVTATVVSHCDSADRIADVIVASGPHRGATVADFANRAPDMSYDDWRLECLTATGPKA